MRRYRAKRDANHAEIQAALERIGCTVLDLSAVGGGCPDIAVGRGGVTFLLEIKAPRALNRDGSLSARDKRSTDGQAAWAASWRGGPVVRVTSVDEALQAVGATLASRPVASLR